ncbi:MAG: lipopolysaccharide heptosyltransferase II [Candidatus Dadabacteria bacterium]|nr:MAG: lipopolysaccharide heptosyltransferase II [Candidatus Dadabacteria bacterium]
MNILVVQTSFPGDIVLSTPVISALRKEYKDAALSVLTTYSGKELLVNSPDIDEIIVYDKRGKDRGLNGFIKILNQIKVKGFDIAFSLHRSYRTSILLFLSRIKVRVGFKDARLSFLYTERIKRPKDQHDVIRNLSLLSYLGRNPSELSTKLRLYPEDPGVVFERLGISDCLAAEYAVIAPGSVWRTKEWEVEGFKSVARYLTDRGIKVLVVGSKKEAEAGRIVCSGSPAVNLTGKTSLSDLVSIVSKCSIVVCNDSLPLHLASAFKRRVVAIFCSTVPSFGFAPWKTESVIIEPGEMSCRPCGRHGRVRCPLGTMACSKGISPDKVISGIEKLLGRSDG